MPEGEGYTFREALLRLLQREGGDFQSATFAADTEVRIHRVSVTGEGRRVIHVRTRLVADLPDCADLVSEEAYSQDFGDDGY